jgi:chloramphenicol-sensitive protein RarD
MAKKSGADMASGGKVDSAHEARTGFVYGLLAYLTWGFFPVFFKAFGAVPALQVVSHRIVWSMIFLLLIIGWGSKWGGLLLVLRDGRALLTLVASATLIAVNWLVFIVAVGHGEVLQSSLGYFITPLVSVLLGFFFLQERLRRLQQVSVALAVVGVLVLTLQQGSFPWTALILAVTFGSYGLLRKVVKADSLTGLSVETCLLGPPALGYLVFVAWQGEGAFLHGPLLTDILLLSAGVVTAVPLLLFAAAARRLRLATIGFLQYITPTLHFLLAVVAYGEPFTRAHLISFIFIWLGLGCYSWDAYRLLAAGGSD